MKAITIILWLILLTGLASCSFNRQFYNPQKLYGPPLKWTVYNPDKSDSMFLDISNLNAGLVFTDSRGNKKDIGYTIESTVFRSSSGNKLNGWFLMPATAKFNGVTILFVHGNGGNILSSIANASQLAKHGFRVFTFDYSGYGFSAGKPTRKNVLADANAALNFIRKRDDVKNTKIIIYGQSLGGHLSATLAMQNEKVVDGLVAEGAFSSHKDIAASMIGVFGFSARILVKERYSAVRSIRHFHKPVLIIHSTEDKTVPFSMGKKIYNNANDPKSFFEIKYCHICGLQHYADTISEKILSMVNKQ